jgi:hypothetical protein
MTATFARLWEDPLRATLTEPEKGNGDNVKRVMKGLAERAAKEGRLHVVPVLVRGGPYPNDLEQRMRTRYAVLSALASNRFQLALADRMTYIVAPIESFIGAAREWKLIDLRVPIKLYSRDENERVLVLWINESQLGDKPINAIAQVLHHLFDEKETRKKVKVSLVGPTSSDKLLAMSRENWQGATPSERSPDFAEAKITKLGVPEMVDFLSRICRRLLQPERFDSSKPASEYKSYSCETLVRDFDEFSIYSPRATIAADDIPDSEMFRDFAEPPSMACQENAGQKGTPTSRPQPSDSEQDDDPNMNETASVKADAGERPKIVRTIGTDRDLVYALEREPGGLRDSGQDGIIGDIQVSA